MMTKPLLLVALAVCASVLAHATPACAEGTRLEIRDYPWQALPGEKNEALERTGNRKRGQKLYALCRSCHQSAGSEQDDGSIAQIAGQHSSVLIKQMADIRAGLRHNPQMFPFVIVPGDPQDLADLAAYLESLCVPAGGGRYAAPDAAQQVAIGKEWYEKDCARCHGAHGEGAWHRMQPAIAGQHHRYLLRQMTDIRDGKRPAADAEMVRVISKYSDEQLLALAAYQSHLVRPDKLCKQPAAAGGKSSGCRQAPCAPSAAAADTRSATRAGQ